MQLAQHEPDGIGAADAGNLPDIGVDQQQPAALPVGQGDRDLIGIARARHPDDVQDQGIGDLHAHCVKAGTERQLAGVGRDHALCGIDQPVDFAAEHRQRSGHEQEHQDQQKSHPEQRMPAPGRDRDPQPPQPFCNRHRHTLRIPAIIGLPTAGQGPQCRPAQSIPVMTLARHDYQRGKQGTLSNSRNFHRCSYSGTCSAPPPVHWSGWPDRVRRYQSA